MVYWIFKSGMVLTWAFRLADKSLSTYGYLVWNSAKYVTRILSTLSQMHTFVCLDIEVITIQEVRDSRTVHTFVPLYMLSLLAIFLSSIIGTYTGTIETWIMMARMNQGFDVLYHIGGPFHLGFCLHVFVHFFILSTNLKAIREQE